MSDVREREPSAAEVVEDAGGTIVRGLVADRRGLCTAVQSIDPNGACDRLRVLRLDDAGRVAETLLERSSDSTVSANGIAALFGVTDPCLSALAVNHADRVDVLALDPSFESAASGLARAAEGYLAALAAGPAGLVAVEERLVGEELVQRVLVAGRDGVTVPDLAPLALGEERMLIALLPDPEGIWLAIADPCAGAALARLGAEGLELRLAEGAHRFALNAAFTSGCATPEGLVVGTAALNDGPLAVGNRGAELILVGSTGWELLMGQPRFTPDGLKQPRSGLGPGFGRSDNTSVKAVATAADGRVHALVQDFTGAAVADRAEIVLDPRDYAGEARLYSSQDLTNWDVMTVPLPAGAGAVTALAASPSGVAVGHEATGAGAVPITWLPVPEC